MNPITVHITLSTPIELVWEYFTSPSHITKWCNASDTWECPLAENDVTVGGKFLTLMRAKDHSMSFPFKGTYTEVAPFEKLAYIIEDERKVTVTFEERAGDTIVTETFEPETIHPEDQQREGWQAILNNFKKYVESLEQ